MGLVGRLLTKVIEPDSHLRVALVEGRDGERHEDLGGVGEVESVLVGGDEGVTEVLYINDTCILWSLLLLVSTDTNLPVDGKTIRECIVTFAMHCQV